MSTSSDIVKGGAFLIQETKPSDIFIPEEASEDEKSLAQLTRNFSKNEVLALSDQIEKDCRSISPVLMKKAGELGLLMAEVPEAYGGLGLGKVPTTFIAENITDQGSFSVTFMCHTGIGTLPIDIFGTEAQKQKYLPKLASGEFIGAYSLTEAGSGSDALGAKTKAVLSPDGKHYILNGEKIWVTNGGFADLFTIFAKVDGEHFTAFLVEKDFPGLSINKDEDKMGIKGSSTTVLALNNLKVPVENVLGEIGKGHHIAFNVLNVGRWKLGAASVGACKRLIEYSVQYVNERKQFGKAISQFQLIRDKIASMAVQTYLNESIVYRYAHMIDVAKATLDAKSAAYDEERKNIIREYAIEASIAKVFGSEALDTVVDEAVQCFGGFGFSEEYPVAKFYRDSRINRIFEGTNEINRMIITGTLLKKAMKGELALMDQLQKVLGQLKTGFSAAKSHEKTILLRLKDLAIYVAGVALKKYAAKIDDKQSVMAFVSDIIISVFALESALLRAIKMETTLSADKAEIPYSICKIAAAEMKEDLFSRANLMLMDMAETDEEYQSYQKALQRLTPTFSLQVLKEREKVAAWLLGKSDFSF